MGNITSNNISEEKKSQQETSTKNDMNFTTQCIYCGSQSQYCTKNNQHYCSLCNITFKFPTISVVSAVEAK